MKRVMHSQETNLLLRIFIGEDAHFDGKPLYESIVLKGARTRARRGNRIARTDGLWTFEPFPYCLHPAHFARSSSLLDGMVKGGLVTLEEIQVVRYGPGQNKLG